MYVYNNNILTTIRRVIRLSVQMEWEMTETSRKITC